MFKKISLCFLIVSFVFVALSGCGDSKDKNKALEAALEKNKELEAELLALAKKAEEEGKAKPPAVSVCDRTQVIQEMILSKVQKTDCKAVTDKDLAAIKTFGRYGKEDFPVLKAGDFSGLTSLGILVIEFDILVNSMPADLFSGLASLEELYVDGTSIDFVPPNLLSGLSALEKIKLDFNLTELPTNFFSGLTRLQEMVLYDPIESYPVGLFSNLPALKVLDINQSAIAFDEKRRIQAEVGPDVEIK